jgi:phage tail-like protein
MAQSRANPYSAFNFVVTLPDGTNTTGFMEVSGLDTENAVIEYREGNDQQPGATGAFVRKVVGMEKYMPVTLKRGITGDLKLWLSLRKPIRDAAIGPELLPVGSVSPTLKVDLQDEQHNTVQSWTLHNAWVAKLSGPSLNAKGNEIAIEAIEVICDRIELS